MDWLYIIIALGSAGFIIHSIIAFLNTSSELEPRANVARDFIEQCEEQIKAEIASTGATKEEVDQLQQKIADMEKELQQLDAQAAHLQSQEQRRREDRIKPQDGPNGPI